MSCVNIRVQQMGDKCLRNKCAVFLEITWGKIRTGEKYITWSARSTDCSHIVSRYIMAPSWYPNISLVMTLYSLRNGFTRARGAVNLVEDKPEMLDVIITPYLIKSKVKHFSNYSILVHFLQHSTIMSFIHLCLCCSIVPMYLSNEQTSKPCAIVLLS